MMGCGKASVALREQRGCGRAGPARAVEHRPTLRPTSEEYEQDLMRKNVSVKTLRENQG